MRTAHPTEHYMYMYMFMYTTLIVKYPLIGSKRTRRQVIAYISQ